MWSFPRNCKQKHTRSLVLHSMRSLMRVMGRPFGVGIAFLRSTAVFPRVFLGSFGIFGSDREQRQKWIEQQHA